MNIDIPFLPERPVKPRTNGLAMVMDKGLSLREAEDFVSVAGHLADFVKLGFGTSLVTKGVEEKIKFYNQNGIQTYLGGTFFEAFVIRGMFDEYRKLLNQLGLNAVEVSDGSVVMNHDEKCGYIEQLTKDFTVLSEVGCKQAGVLISDENWIRMMQSELQAGAFKVIAEARESGNVGIYQSNGSANEELINKILKNVKMEDILWESPQKSQQAWFIKQFGANVNLGNIAPHELIPLETLRLGLRGDTFFTFLPEEFQAQRFEVNKDGQK